MNNSPTHTYYRGAHGRWRGVMNTKVIDARAVIGAMGCLNGICALMLAWWPRWLGQIHLVTTVSYHPEKPVRHTTSIYWLSVPMMRSVENLTLDDDGIHFTIDGTSRITMLPWRRLVMKGAGEIDPTARHATYNLAWMGTEFLQKTTRRDDGVTLVQEAPGLRSTQVLTAAKK